MNNFTVFMLSCVIFGLTFVGAYGLGILTEEPDRGYLMVYVAGSYWADTHEGRTANTYKAMDAGIHVYFKCHYAIIPHLGHWVDPRMTELGYPERPNSFWYVLDNMVLYDADIMLKISEQGQSRGADAEEKLAQSLGIPVVYSLDDIPDNCPEGGFEEFYDGSGIG